jgi:exodeoxyribonuclease VII small subunit
VEIIVAKKKLGDQEQAALTFEESLGELEEIVTKLEGGKLGLSDALAAYETGVQRLKACYQILQHAERRIELVQSLDANGRAKTTPLDDDESDDLAEKSAARSRRRTSSAQRDSDRVDDDGSLF